MYDFSKHLFRCSSWGNLFTDPMGKSNRQKYDEAVEKAQKLVNEYALMDSKLKSAQNKLEAIKKTKQLILDLEPVKDEKNLSLTAKKHLLDVYTANQHGLHKNLITRALEKGTVCEEDSITLYSRVKKTYFTNNKLRLTNAFVQGEPDIYTGKSITTAIKVTDTKTSWDGITFHRTLAEEVKDIYFYQGQGYMWLTGAKEASVAYCLVNTPIGLIEQSKKRLWYDLGCPDETSDLYLDCCKELEKSMKFDHIPLQERVIEFNFEFDPLVIEEGKDRISDARKYLVNLQKERTQLSQ